MYQLSTTRIVGLIQERYPPDIEDIGCLPLVDDNEADMPRYFHQHLTRENEFIFKGDWKHLVTHVQSKYGVRPDQSGRLEPRWGLYGLDVEIKYPEYAFPNFIDLSHKYLNKTIEQLVESYNKIEETMKRNCDVRFTAAAIQEVEKSTMLQNLKRKLSRYAQVILYRREKLYYHQPLQFLKIAWFKSIENYFLDLKNYDEKYPNVKKISRFNYKNQLRRKHRLPLRIKYNKYQKAAFMREIMEKHNEKKRKIMKEQEQAEKELIQDVMEIEAQEEEDERLAKELGWDLKTLQLVKASI